MPAPTAPRRPTTAEPRSERERELEPEPTSALSLAMAPPAPTLPDISGNSVETDVIVDTEPVPAAEEDVEMDVEMDVDEDGRPRFAEGDDANPVLRPETRKISIPPNRMSPLKANWTKIYPPLVNHCHLNVRMNVKEKRVELRTSRHTRNPELIQTGADFVSAFAMGFDVDDCVALLRLDSLYIQTFDIKDVKFALSADALSRAIGRVAGKDGKTKFAIENATRTRIVIAGSRIHILGAFENIAKARESISSLILGAQPGKVYNTLRIIQSRMKERM